MEMNITQDSSRKKKAALLSIIPGVGQFYNKQIIKGAIFLIFFVAYLFVFKDLFNMGIWGLLTLGTEVPRDNSIFLLAEGLVALIVISFGLLFYFLNIRDAYKNGEKIGMGHKPATIRESYQALLAEGYPYLISSPAFLLLVFSVIFRSFLVLR